MTTGKIASFALLLTMIVSLLGACSSEKEKTADTTTAGSPDTTGRSFTGERADDKAEIQALWDELLVRVHEDDYGILYDNEFPYLRDKYTYDDYLRFDQLKSFDFDTVKAINIVEFTFVGEDTCDIMLEAVFRNAPPGQDRAQNKARVYRRDGHWIKPTISGVGNGLQLQRQFERTVFEAESAAAAEAEEGL
jgi:hypothetical protein